MRILTCFLQKGILKDTMRGSKKSIGFFACWTLVFGFLLSSCVIKLPKQEYTKARVGVFYAQKAKAQKYAPEFWGPMDESYHKASLCLREQRYPCAARFFLESVGYAEKAEATARRRKSPEDDFSF